MKFEVGETIYNFTVNSVEAIAEVDGMAYTLRHEPSGARLLYIANNDVEKNFTIGFKTPPADNTGTFHIIEHSVLCGSERFPVKEPFVHLLKSSMQTFLNAITFADKTIYPVSSTNEADLLNLMDVYMDAVLHPMLYEKESTFEQEGWHVEVAADKDGMTLAYNGIVYNEMKGALSDPNSKLSNALDAVMFPDTAYGFVSGGTPSAIPTLTYEKLLDAHRRHYSLSNSYIGLYGKLDVERFLSFLDEKYLTPHANRFAGETVGSPNPLEFQAPVRSTGNVVRVVTDPKNAGMVIGYGAGSFADRTRMLAIEILLQALMGNNEAPLKRALLEAGLSDEARGGLNDGVLQPYVVFTLRGMKPGSEKRFREVLETRARELADGGLDRGLVEAALLSSEFSMCESNYGSTSGLNLYRRALEGWLYDDACATTYLRFEDAYRTLKEGLAHGYFEQLLYELLCDNPHTADVQLVPIGVGEAETSEVDERLAARAKELDKDGFAEIEQEVERLRSAQEAPDTPEALSTLPYLELEDLGDSPSEPSYHMELSGPMSIIRHDVNTRGIVYAERCFDVSSIAYEELPYLSILSQCFLNLDTQSHTVTELSTLVKSRLGQLRFSIDLYDSAAEFGVFKPVLSVYTSSREDRAADAARIAREVMVETVFDNRAKLEKLLLQRLVRMRQSLSSGSAWLARQRAASYYLPSAIAEESLNGIDFYRFLRDLVANFDERYGDLVCKLYELSGRIFADDRCLVSFVGSDDALERFLCAAGSLGSAGGLSRSRMVLPVPTMRNEAFLAPADVTYSALSYDYRLLDMAYSGSWAVVCKALSYEYLWDEVRVKGGAYGGEFDVKRTGSICFSAWRDPHLQRTIECFRSGAEWLAKFEPRSSDFKGYIISAVADMDAPVKPRNWGRRQLRDFLEGYTPQMKRQIREQAINTTPDDVRRMAQAMQAVIDKGARCAIGNKDAINRSNCGFNPVDVLGE